MCISVVCNTESWGRVARMNISVPDKLYERYKRNEERLNASRVCAEALARELDVLEGVEGVGEQDEAAVMQMVERLMDAKEHSYGWGYGDGRAWGLAHATRTALHTAKELKDYSGRQMLTDPREPVAEDDDATREFNAELPQEDIPGLLDEVPATSSRWYVAQSCLERHLAQGQEADVEAYAEGWRDALADLYDILRKAEKGKRLPRPR
jgi:post-segregation antitoxin (ccd killing protein)